MYTIRDIRHSTDHILGKTNVKYLITYLRRYYNKLIYGAQREFSKCRMRRLEKLQHAEEKKQFLSIPEAKKKTLIYP